MVQQARVSKIVQAVARYQALILCIVAVGLYLSLALQRLDAPFIRVSEDTNGSNGMAAYNWYRFGVGALKGGLVVHWLPEAEFLKREVTYYADHPSGFLVPTFIAYKLFGVREWTTRIGPLFIVTCGIIALYWALNAVFRDSRKAFWSIVGFVLLPGTVYYGKHLDMQPLALGWALITFSLFVFYYERQDRFRLALFFTSAVIGCFTAWHFYFILLGIWCVVLLGKSAKSIRHRRAFVFGLPVLVVACFLLTLFHIYALGGREALETLRGSFLNRSGGVLVFALQWYRDVAMRFNLNATWYWIGVSLAGVLAFLWKRPRQIEKELLTPLWIMPVGVIAVFQSWTTHPFGPIYFLPIIGVGVGMLCAALTEQWKSMGLIAALAVLCVGAFFSLQKLDFFYEEFLILSDTDIGLLKERIAPQGDAVKLCVGQNDFGLYYGGIIDWYTRRQSLISPQCFAGDIAAPRMGLLFRGPRDFYQQEAERFLEKGFVINPDDCAGLWCLVTRPE